MTELQEGFGLTSCWLLQCFRITGKDDDICSHLWSEDEQQLRWSLLTAPVEGDGCDDDGDSSYNGDDGQHHGVPAQSASSVHVPLLEAVPGLHRSRGAVWGG